MVGMAGKLTEMDTMVTMICRFTNFVGKNAFVTSFSLCKKTQEVDLFRFGLNSQVMASSPTIVASVWVRGSGPKNFNDKCYVNVVLLNEQKQPIAQWFTGLLTTVN